MSNIDKQAVSGDVSPKTYFIHPMAFGGTQNPGHGHVPVVHADDFEKLQAKLEAAEKRIAELEAREVNLPKYCVAEVMLLSGFDRQYAEGWCAGNDNAIHEINAAGVKVGSGGVK
ncbi:hypothetical protein EWI30_08820 [Enterobacter cloacae]|nr:hypothetical protein [Enterobacter cloacae]QBC02168.1 hypothetical protein EWI30_08820 [Enterobacter cloacae]